MQPSCLLLVEEGGVCCHGWPRWTPLRPLLTIGRFPDNDFVVDDPAVSAHHLTVFTNRGQWIIFDRGSRNGTLVRRQRIAQSTPLRAGDEVHIGRSRLLFEPLWPGHASSGQDEPLGEPSRRPPELASKPAAFTPPARAASVRLGSLSDALVVVCTGLLAEGTVERAALFLPDRVGQLVPRASWRWPLVELKPIRPHIWSTLTAAGAGALEWNEPGALARRHARVHVLRALPADADRTVERHGPRPLALAAQGEPGALWLQCRRVDADRRVAISRAVAWLGGELHDAGYDADGS
jgi:hypothetical protein